MRILRVLLTCLVLSLAAPAAQACAVCVDLPENTLADHVLGSEVTVLARPDPQNGFRFAPTELLSGDPQAYAKLPDIPFLVSSAARRQLRANPDWAVLMTYGTTGPAPGNAAKEPKWQQFMIVTPYRRGVVQRILTEGRDWVAGMTADPERFDFFASFVASKDPGIQKSALAEISRAPYAMIRSLRDVLPQDELRRRLANINELSYAPVHILLLGLSAAPEARAHVLKSFDSALRFGGSFTDAWAVAGIEVGGSAAIDKIGAKLARRMVRDTVRQDLVLALSVVGTARPGLRPEISPILQAEARKDPTIAASVAYTFYDWRDWSLTDHFRDLLERPETDNAARYILGIMVYSAERAGVTAPSGG